MGEAVDKKKLLEFLDEEIESCGIVKTPDDRAITWELKRIKKRIENGQFDIDKEKPRD